MVNIKKLNLANTYLKNKDYKSAEKIYYELLHDYPENETVLSFWGFFNFKIGKYEKAEKILESAYNKRKTAPTISALAATKFKLEKFDDAVILYEELLRFDKNNEFIYKNIIDCFDALDMQLFQEAYTQKFLTLFPDSEKAIMFVLKKYYSQGLYKKAEEYCAIALEKYPQNPDAWTIAGFLQEVIYNNEECARECYISAINLGNQEGLYHLAVTFQKSGNKKQAEEIFLKALDKKIKADVECAYGLMLFSQREFQKGYPHYLKRQFVTTFGQVPDEKIIEKYWRNPEIKIEPDKKVMVYVDQGMGDIIMFSRYLPYLKEKHPNLVVLMRKPIFDIMKRTFPEIEFVEDISVDDFDNMIVISDVPAYLGMDFYHIPSPEGYLKLDEAKRSEYNEKYFNNDKLKIGFCWKAGSMAIRDHINRTINIDFFKSMFETFKSDDRIQFYSLQKDDIFDGIKKYPQMIDLSEELETFDDTAAIVKNLDLVITVDTSLLHIAGAIGGVNTVGLLPYCSDWRWFDNTEKTEWYDSVRLIKQVGRQEWYEEVDKVIEIINQELIKKGGN